MESRTAIYLLGASAVGLGVLIVTRTADAEDPETRCAVSYIADYAPPLRDPATGEWLGQTQEQAVAQARTELPELQAQRERAGDTESFEMLPGVYDALSRLYALAEPSRSPGGTSLSEPDDNALSDTAEWNYVRDGEVQGALIFRDLTARFEEDLPSYWVIEEKSILVPEGTCDAPPPPDAPPAEPVSKE